VRHYCTVGKHESPDEFGAGEEFLTILNVVSRSDTPRHRDAGIARAVAARCRKVFMSLVFRVRDCGMASLLADGVRDDLASLPVRRQSPPDADAARPPSRDDRASDAQPERIPRAPSLRRPSDLSVAKQFSPAITVSPNGISAAPSRPDRTTPKPGSGSPPPMTGSSASTSPTAPMNNF
jgi:hypothetical protein